MSTPTSKPTTQSITTTTTIKPSPKPTLPSTLHLIPSTLHLTQDHIDDGIPHCEHECPIAYMVKDTLGYDEDDRSINVTYDGVTIFYDDDHDAYLEVSLDDKLTQFIELYDNGLAAFEPCTLTYDEKQNLIFVNEDESTKGWYVTDDE